MRLSMLNQLLDGTFPDFVDAPIPLPEDIEEEIAEMGEYKYPFQKMGQNTPIKSIFSNAARRRSRGGR